jgi:hypothetical protein
VKSIPNQAIHGFLAWAEELRSVGTTSVSPRSEMRKRWRAGHSSVYPSVAGQAKLIYRRDEKRCITETVRGVQRRDFPASSRIPPISSGGYRISQRDN